METLLDLAPHVLHPPTHENHIPALYTSITALKRCLSFDTHDAFTTCQTWTLLAETGLSILAAGLTSVPNPPSWCENIENDVETAIAKGLQISHTSKIALRPFWIHLTLLHVHLAIWQRNAKLSRAILKRIRSALVPTDPPAIHYTVLLTQHANLLNSENTTLSPAEIQGALALCTDLFNLASSNGQESVMKLALVTRLRTLVRANMWHIHIHSSSSSSSRKVSVASQSNIASSSTMSASAAITSTSVQALLPFLEQALNLEINTPHPSQDPVSTQNDQQPPAPVAPEIESLQAHVLITGVLFSTLLGDAKTASLRLGRLHKLLDSGALAVDSSGPGIGRVQEGAYLRFQLGPSQPPLIIQTTHPRVLFELAFLVSSVSKRDVVGRKPRRWVFAVEGLRVAVTSTDEVFFPVWATIGDAREVEDRLAKIKADLMCEMVAIAIIRSEVEDVEQQIARLIAHTRNYNLFSFYAARITLHQAHLAHACGQHGRALDCYRAAAFLDSDSSPAVSSGPFSPSGTGGRTSDVVRTAARAGEVGLRVGLRAARYASSPSRNARSPSRMEFDQSPNSARDIFDEDILDSTSLNTMAGEVIEECRSFPGTLAAVGRLLEAVVIGEIVKAKQRLKSALDIATLSQDNHLRALIIALTSAHYVHTAGAHAKVMLDTARQLAAGMGASAIRPGSHDASGDGGSGVENGIGNAPLGLWIGERFYELFQRQGDSHNAREQNQANEALRSAVRALPLRYAEQQQRYSQSQAMPQRQQ